MGRQLVIFLIKYVALLASCVAFAWMRDWAYDAYRRHLLRKFRAPQGIDDARLDKLEQDLKSSGRLADDDLNPDG